MQIRFLLGPAGSGKTHRCLAEIREALHEDSERLPLVLLAPKQATFQLERQLLAGQQLPGYTRLHILSFERLAEFIFDQFGKTVPKLLAEEGRVMVLRALLEQKRGELKLFRASARLPGFARQLSQLLRELQQYHLTPARLENLAAEVGSSNRLNAKLQDLAMILRAYSDWLQAHALQDADCFLDLATQALKTSAAKTINQFALSPREERTGRELEGGVSDPNTSSPQPSPPAALGREGEISARRTQLPSPEFVATSGGSNLQLGGLWLDGFAQMTPQERQLLAAVTRCSPRTTLAFCLDEPKQSPPWHSLWAPVTETFQHCRDELGSLPDAEVKIELLSRNPGQSRFESPMLRHLETHWSKPVEFTNDDLRSTSSSANSSAVRLVSCVNPEAEVEFAAREICRYVRESKGRFRDAAVLLRSLDGYHDIIRRVFFRYDIPFFLDRREAVTHHPLAELTRYALRLVAYGWEHDDWFGVLKTGLVHADETSIDRLENEALARGWRGQSFWSEPMKSSGAPDARIEWPEELRQKLSPPFLRFAEALSSPDRRVNGSRLTIAIRELWAGLKVDRTLDRWTKDAQENDSATHPALHETVWTQMAAWLENIDLAFASEALALNEWLPIVEAGLGNLSVGVIPPALDQVLVGAVDRSRNPDLQVVFVLGANEGVFPATPVAPMLLNRSDRETLASHNAPVGPDYLSQIGLERYYGYIACTRARSRLALTFAHSDKDGRELNPSVFVSDLQRLFPAVPVENFSGAIDWKDSQHWSELIVPMLKDAELAGRPELNHATPAIQDALEKWRLVNGSGADEALPPALVEKIYGRELRSSVSALEDFAACPFRFFVGRGLRAEERVEFEIDSREKGSFQHDVLKEFHLRLQNAGKRWRDVTPAEARALVRQIGEELLPAFKDGLFVAAQARRFTGEMLIEGLERLMETLIAWTAQYQFDPAAVETSFGLEEGGLPAWRIDLDSEHALLLRGRIDRVDICRIADSGETLAVVIDYKSSARELDKVLLQHGLELQLLAYLGALRQFKSFLGDPDLTKLIPAGAFYVALKGRGGSADTRDEERETRDQTRRGGCQHRGRFDGGRLKHFDSSGAAKGDQFQFAIKQDGAFAARGNEALLPPEFSALVDQVEEFLRQHGRDIYAGKVSIAPFRWKKETACDFCDYRPVCRFDPWTQPFRVLRANPK